MKNSIEVIWKEGFLNEKSLVAPKINDLYNQKSNHLFHRVRRIFIVNYVIILTIAIVLPILYTFIGFFWHGAIASVLLALTAAYYSYYQQQIIGIGSLNQGATTLDYLKSFEGWLTNVLATSKKIARITYPIYCLVALSIIWTVWSKQRENDSLFTIGIVGVIIFLVFLFSDRIYKWELGFMYGRVLRKLKETIAEMEQLTAVEEQK